MSSQVFNELQKWWKLLYFIAIIVFEYLQFCFQEEKPLIMR